MGRERTLFGQEFTEEAPLAVAEAARVERQGGRVSRRLVLAGLAGLSGTVALPFVSRDPFAGAARAAGGERIIRAHGISTFGDLKYPADFPHLDYVNPAAPKGGEISTWALGTFDSLHPYIIKGNAASSATIFFESLMEGTADEPDALYGLLAESIEYPENRQWCIFTLREEARFSDGSPVTAEDVVFTYETLRDKGIPSLKVIFADFEKVEALDRRRVKYTFREGASTRELPMTAAGLPVFSKAWWSTRDFSRSTLEAPLGTSPWVLEAMEPGRRIVYRRNPDYWGRDLPLNRGRHNFDRIRFEYYGDSAPAFEGFKGGSYTFRNENFSKLWAEAYDFPAVRKGWVKREEIPDGNVAPAQGFYFNLRRRKFADPRVREAIGLMFNFEWSNRTLFYGLYKRIDSFWENSPLEAKGLPSPEELALLEPVREHVPPEVFTEPAWSPPRSSERQLDRRLLRKASRLMEAAGWKIVGGVRTNAAGERLEVEFLNVSQAFERIINPFIENLGRLGVKARLRLADLPQFLERQRKHDFDIITTTYSNSLTPGLELRQRWSSEAADIPSRNIAGVKNKGVDALVEAVIAARSREEMTVAVHALDRTLRAMKPWVPQWFKDRHTVAYLDIYDHPDPLPPYDPGFFDLWWVSPAKVARLKAEGAL